MATILTEIACFTPKSGLIAKTHEATRIELCIQSKANGTEPEHGHPE